MTPEARGSVGLMWHRMGITKEDRQTRRDEILSTTRKSVAEFGELLAAARSHTLAGVVTSQALFSSESSELEAERWVLEDGMADKE